MAAPHVRSDLQLLYSGLETDQFVALTMRAASAGYYLAVEVRGREPITSTPAHIVGRAVSASDEGYARTLRVQTAHGTHFNVGGTNTTKSIASELVAFSDVPAAIAPAVADPDSLAQWVSATTSADIQSVLKALEALALGVRSRAVPPENYGQLFDACRRLVGSGSEETRAASLLLLALAGGDRALPVLSSALTDDSALVRRQAALRLRGMDAVIAADRDAPEARAAVTALVQALLRDPDADVRTYAAEDLGYFYDAEAIAALYKVVRDDESQDVRWSATVAIGRTNDVDAVRQLEGVLGRETDASIRRAAFLGIGRQGPDLVRRSKADAAAVADRLGEIVRTASSAGVDYALYALGELGSDAAQYLSTVVASVTAGDIQIQATAIMALTKLLPYSDPAPSRDAILSAIASSLHADEPTDWPEVGFYRAFLNSAGELAMALEEFALADATFAVAARTKEQAAWLKDYYTGAALYARAEAGIATGERITEIRDLLAGALEAFQHVETSDAFAETDPARSGLSLKQTLAAARLAVLSALNEWRPHGFTHQSIERVEQHLAKASEQYRRLDLFGLSPTERRLSGQEVSLVTCLQMIVEIMESVCHLGHATIDHDPQRVSYALGDVKVRSRHFATRAHDTQSPSLTDLAVALTSLLDEMGHRDDAEVASEFLDRIPPLLERPAPAPGTCPIVTFGVATMDLSVADAAKGTGTRDKPYIVSPSHELILEGTVHVEHRTKDDELLFEATARVAAQSDATQYVPVREGSYPLRPIAFGTLVPSSAPLPIKATLSFRNRGCLQPAAEHEIWVRCDAAVNLRTSRPHIPTLEAEVSDLERRVAELDAILRQHPHERTSAARRRALQQDLEGKRQELATARKLIDDDEADGSG